MYKMMTVEKSNLNCYFILLDFLVSCIVQDAGD